MTFFQNCSSRREEAPYSMYSVKFEPRYLGCYAVLKKALVLLINHWVVELVALRSNIGCCGIFESVSNGGDFPDMAF